MCDLRGGCAAQADHVELNGSLSRAFARIAGTSDEVTALAVGRIKLAGKAAVGLGHGLDGGAKAFVDYIYLNGTASHVATGNLTAQTHGLALGVNLLIGAYRSSE